MKVLLGAFNQEMALTGARDLLLDCEIFAKVFEALDLTPLLGNGCVSACVVGRSWWAGAAGC